MHHNTPCIFIIFMMSAAAISCTELTDSRSCSPEGTVQIDSATNFKYQICIKAGDLDNPDRICEIFHICDAESAKKLRSINKAYKDQDPIKQIWASVDCSIISDINSKVGIDYFHNGYSCICEEGSLKGELICDRGKYVPQTCKNHKLDEGETGIDCGGSCNACIQCDSLHSCNNIDHYGPLSHDYYCSMQAKGTENNEVCVPKCTPDIDASADSDGSPYRVNGVYTQGSCPLGEICRADGRCASQSFVTVWKLTNTDNQITLRHDGVSPCRCTIDWGDGSVPIKDIDCKDASKLSHTYSIPTSGKEIRVAITGQYDGWGMPESSFFNQTVNSIDSFSLEKVPSVNAMRVESFGPVGLTHLAFANIHRLELPPDEIPDASKLTTIKGMFAFHDKHTASMLQLSNINWDTSNVKDMSYVFYNNTIFDHEIRWNTARAETMRNMFGNAESFSHAVNFVTDSVTDMSFMFSGAKAFNEKVNYNTSNVNTMRGMFHNTKRFNQSLASFDTSKVTDMSVMFMNAYMFNNPVNFDTSSVKNMNQMFKNAEMFNNPVEFDTSSTILMKGMFDGARSFNQPINFNTANVKDMNRMFADAVLFNQPIREPTKP